MSLKKMISMILNQKTRKNLTVCIVLLFILMTVTGFVSGYKTVNVLVDGNTQVVNTLFSSPGRILEQAGVQLQDKDEYRLSTDEVKNHTVITVYRAVPVTVEFQGKKQEFITGKPTVGELLSELGYNGAGYDVTPGMTSKIQEKLNIKVEAVSEKIIEHEEQDAYQTVRQPDPDMEKGSEQVVQYGANGVKTLKVKELYRDGVKTGEEVIDSTETVPSQPEIIKVGARDTVTTSRGAMRFNRTIYMEASAYLPSDGGGAGITATGMAARRGIVAVDPNVIPLGTRLFIPGYGMAIAADTGGAIQGNKVDLCMENYGEAMDFGRQTVKVYVLD
jgi:uncharacterized protein YabE (DUF348 family)